MVEKDRKLTVLVLGEAGQSTRRYRIDRRAITLLVLALLCVSLGLGYVLGNRRASRSSVASIASSTTRATPADPPAAMPARTPTAIAPTAEARPVDIAVLAAEPQPTETVPMPGATPVEAPATGEPLLLLRDGQNAEAIELHPFAPDGSARTSDFDQLATLMACGSGHSQRPEASLVRAMLDAHRHFGKALVLLGGRCSAHDDHPDTAAHHRAGRAADLRVRGVSSEQLASWLVKHGVAGVGRYQRGGFVHIDVRTGPHEQWETARPDADKAVAKPAPALAAPSGSEQAPTQEAQAEPAAPAQPLAIEQE